MKNIDNCNFYRSQLTLKKQIVFLYFFFFSISVFAQVPGYQGKRLALYFSPAIGIAANDFSGLYDSVSTFGINFRPEFAVDYTVSLTNAIGAAYHNSAPVIYGAAFMDGFDSDGTYSLAFYSGYSGDVKVHAKGFSLYLKHFNFFNNGSIAPIGKYSKFEFCVLKLTGEAIGTRTPIDDDYYSDSYYALYEDLSELPYGDSTTYSTGFIYTFGQQLLYGENLFISFGGELGFFPQLFNIGANLRQKDFTYTGDAYFDAMKARIAGAYSISVNVAIGFIAL